MTATRIDNVLFDTKSSCRDEIRKYGIHTGYKVISFDEKEKLQELVELHIAFSANGTAYAFLWVYGYHWYTIGSGMAASGSEYCKESTATEIAINSAGYQLSENISGVGYDAIVRALIAIAETLTDNPVHVIEMCS